MSDTEQTFPITAFIESNPLNQGLLRRYLAHVEPLGIELRGRGLLVGVDETSFEFAIVEQQLEQLTEIDILSLASSPEIFIDMLALDHRFTQIQTYRHTIQAHLEQQGPHQYDSLLWTGVSPATLTPEVINTIGALLADGGAAYLTVQDYVEAVSPWQHSHLDLNVVPNLPPHPIPISPPVPPYFGLVIENHT